MSLTLFAGNSPQELVGTLRSFNCWPSIYTVGRLIAATSRRYVLLGLSNSWCRTFRSLLYKWRAGRHPGIAFRARRCATGKRWIFWSCKVICEDSTAWWGWACGSSIGRLILWRNFPRLRHRLVGFLFMFIALCRTSNSLPVVAIIEDHLLVHNHGKVLPKKDPIICQPTILSCCLWNHKCASPSHLSISTFPQDLFMILFATISSLLTPDTVFCWNMQANHCHFNTKLMILQRWHY